MEEHDQILQTMLEAARRDSFTLNEEKSKFSMESVNLLGYQISHGESRPDSRRLQPLLNLPPPESLRELKRVTGMVAYYARWIEIFSKRAGPLLRARHFPLSKDALKIFEDVKSGLAKVRLGAIRDNVPFEVESDASDYAFAAILSNTGDLLRLCREL